MKPFTIGILALQGCIDPHRPHVEALDIKFKEVKTAKHLEEVDAYILPGGESTTMLRLIKIFGLKEILAMEFAKKPVWGICAGAILMASKVTNPKQESFSLLDFEIERNSYGGQLQSTEIDIKDYPVSFIRAPIINKVSDDIEVVSKYKNTPVWLKTPQYMVTTFHPELTKTYPSQMHKEFGELIAAYYEKG
ncbi:MAG: pyridoxal 5'-phosphate synthase glutaminase subunit PdxT [Alphaproteobacteria bacterium]|nr:pyridoxal 5'-phosphate synthase glutaminase subunit PdxT [Alphaproteobacteria bacterium]